MFDKIRKFIISIGFMRYIKKIPGDWKFEGNSLSATYKNNTIKIHHTFDKVSKLVCEINGKTKLTLEDKDGYLYHTVFHFYYDKMHKIHTENMGYNMDMDSVLKLIEKVVKEDEL